MDSKIWYHNSRDSTSWLNQSHFNSPKFYAFKGSSADYIYHSYTVWRIWLAETILIVARLTIKC